MSKTSELWANQQQQSRNMRTDLYALAQSEFPNGVDVRWIRTFASDGSAKYLNGVVHDMNTHRATVKTKTGKLHQVELWALEHMPNVR